VSSPVRRGLTRLGAVFASPLSLVLAALYLVAWIAIEPQTLDFHGAVAMFTLFMALIIERTQRRDSAALQAKLDELIKATEGARNEMARLDEKELEEIEQARKRG
jgi:low affinity Fe/Cu permease